MRTFLFLLFSAFAMMGCNQPTKESAVNTADVSKIEGVWLNINYYRAIMSTKSPRIAQDSAQVSLAYIPDKLDSNILFIHHFHEGGDYGYLHFDTEKNKFFLGMPSDTISRSYFTFINELLVFNNDTFMKLSGKPYEEKVLEEILFKGKYTSDGKMVEFTKTGEITGLDTFSYYYPLIDYNDVALNIDQLEMGSNKENAKNYGFVFVKDTLQIYELAFVDSNEAEVKNEKLIYKLIKQ